MKRLMKYPPQLPVFRVRAEGDHLDGKIVVGTGLPERVLYLGWPSIGVVAPLYFDHQIEWWGYNHLNLAPLTRAAVEMLEIAKQGER